MTQKLILLTGFLFAFQIGIVFSQQSTDTSGVKKTSIGRPNIIKINTLAALFKNTTLVYERGLMPRLSVSLGIGYKFAGTEPQLLSANNSTIGVDIDKITGFSITPELRYYLRACDKTVLDGFYAALYLRHTNYKTSAKFAYMPENLPTQNLDADLTMKEFGVGIQLGYQMIIKKRLSLDFQFFGPRFSRYNLAYGFQQTPGQEFLTDLSDYLNEVIDRFGLDYTVDVQKQGNTSAKSSFSFVNARFGFSIGYAF